jgi:anti-sigma-K factor RskA
MNDMHPTEERLNDFVDGLLEGETRDGVEAHLDRCAACRREVESLRTLLASAAALPGAIEPPDDLWDEIADRTVRRGTVLRRTLWEARMPLAAAALILVMVTAGSTALLLQGRGGEAPGMAVTAGPEETILLAAHEVEREYAGTVEELRRAFLARRSELAPETVAVVEENLLIIDAAIRTTRAALEADPGNERLPHLLASTYRQKIDVLERTLRLSQS